MHLKTGLLCKDMFLLCEGKGYMGLDSLKVVWIRAENVLLYFLLQGKYMVYIWKYTRMNVPTLILYFLLSLIFINILATLLFTWDFAGFWLWFCHSCSLLFMQGQMFVKWLHWCLWVETAINVLKASLQVLWICRGKWQTLRRDGPINQFCTKKKQT